VRVARFVRTTAHRGRRLRPPCRQRQVGL